MNFILVVLIEFEPVKILIRRKVGIGMHFFSSNSKADTFEPHLFINNLSHEIYNLY